MSDDVDLSQNELEVGNINVEVNGSSQVKQAPRVVQVMEL